MLIKIKVAVFVWGRPGFPLKHWMMDVCWWFHFCFSLHPRVRYFLPFLSTPAVFKQLHQRWGHPLELNLFILLLFSYFYKLLILIFIPVSFPRLSNFGNHRLDFLSPCPSLMASVQFLWFNPDKTSSYHCCITLFVVTVDPVHRCFFSFTYIWLHMITISCRCFMVFHFIVDESVKERSNPGESIDSIVDVKVSKIIDKHI